MAQQAPMTSSQQGRSQTSNSKGDERDFVRGARPEETAAASSGDGINDSGVCLFDWVCCTELKGNQNQGIDA
jgi:hypothetical protein